MYEEIADSVTNGQWKQAAEQMIQLSENSNEFYADILQELADNYSVSMEDIFRLLRTAEKAVLK